ncbi:ABC transporter permease [Acidisoma cellulosilytica]|uniref:ABC transporter permease n=1 Tax=Acidisoma cellulosilyticum TaxID=2802395 RepID=A0A963Z5H7_9PROT|nr:ABC transporter permease [Acidisoma cellulosilyticum]MCB8883177.1 ABC transporter permease [Acidisoma cellulosilyticum]
MDAQEGPQRTPPDRNPWHQTLWSIVQARPRFAIGYIIVALVMIGAIFAPVLAPYNPVSANPQSALLSPSAAHWFGTDAVGMDVFSRCLYAPRIDLTIAVSGTLISAVIGSLIGAWVGFHGRSKGVRQGIGFVIMRAADVLQAFPVFVLAIALVASLGQSIQTVVIAIAFVNIPIYLRLMRSQVISIREMKFVEAAEVAGVSHSKIILRHVIPNAMAPTLAQLSINIGWSVIMTAGLSFIGAGVRAPTPEWGSMIAAGFQNIVTGQWSPSVFPGVVLAITVFGFSLVGASVETFADPAKVRRLVADIAARKRRASAPRAALGRGQ